MPKHAERLQEHSHATPSKGQGEDLAVSDRPRPLAPGAILQRAALAPQSLRPADISRLQQTLGNRAVAQLLSQRSPSRSLVQAKLIVNAPGDKYEQEADRVADDVIQAPTVQRAALEDEDAKPAVMTMPQASATAGGAFEAGEAFEQKLRAARGQGRPLPTAFKADFEATFDANFGGVRIHADAQSDQLNRSIHAQAFTTGQDIFLRQGEDNLSSLSGQWMLAHELTHVLQQGGGRSDQAQTPAASRASDFPVQRLVSKADFVKLAGEPSTKSSLDLAGGTYTDITKKLEEYGKAKKPKEKTKTLNDLKTLCTKWIAKHTQGGKAKKTKNLRKADYIEGLLEEVKAELGEAYDQSVYTPTELTQEEAEKLKKATTAVKAVATNTQPATRWVLTLLATVENPDLLPFAEKRLKLTIANEKKGLFSEKKTGKEIKTEAATSVVEKKGQAMTDEAKKVAVDKIVAESSQVGHTWVKLKKYDAKDKQLAEHSFGFYPLEAYNRPELAVPGEVVYNDTLHERDTDRLAKDYELSSGEYDQALDLALEIMAARPDYKLVEYNCTMFAKEVVKAAGQEFPGKAFMRVPANAVSAVSGVGWGKAYNPNALYGKLSERMEQYKSEGAEQHEQLEAEKRRASVYIPSGQPQPQGALALGSSHGWLEGSEDESQSEGMAEKLKPWIGKVFTLSKPIVAYKGTLERRANQKTNIAKGTDVRLMEVLDDEASFEVARAGVHVTEDLAQLVAALGIL
jgi:hypothetical protein